MHVKSNHKEFEIYEKRRLYQTIKRIVSNKNEEFYESKFIYTSDDIKFLRFQIHEILKYSPELTITLLILLPTTPNITPYHSSAKQFTVLLICYDTIHSSIT